MSRKIGLALFNAGTLVVISGGLAMLGFVGAQGVVREIEEIAVVRRHSSPTLEKLVRHQGYNISSAFPSDRHEALEYACNKAQNTAQFGQSPICEAYSQIPAKLVESGYDRMNAVPQGAAATMIIGYGILFVGAAQIVYDKARQTRRPQQGAINHHLGA